MNKIYPENFSFFQSESLKLDYIRFNLNYLESNQILKLASYFQTLGFNSYQKDRDESRYRQEIKFDSKNQFEVVFFLYTKYPRGTHLQFSGSHATKLYHLIKQKRIQWKNLTEFDPILRRFDICYDGKNLFLPIAELFDGKFIIVDFVSSYIIGYISLTNKLINILVKNIF